MGKGVILLGLLLSLFPLVGYGQSGTVTETNLKTVTATAGTGTTGVICVFTNPQTPTFHAECKIGTTVVLTMDTTPSVGATNGAVGSFSNAANSITWIVQQPTAGNVIWQVAANGVSRSGTF